MANPPNKKKRGRKPEIDDVYVTKSLKKIDEWEKEIEPLKAKLE
jgi:hypothetical protein